MKTSPYRTVIDALSLNITQIMKKKSLQSLKEMEKNQLIDELLLKTIKGGCCRNGEHTLETTYLGALLDLEEDPPQTSPQT